MSFFSVAQQRATDPETGLSVEFSVDPVDSSICYCRVQAAGVADYLRLAFRRQGDLLRTETIRPDETRTTEVKARGPADPPLPPGVVNTTASLADKPEESHG